MKLFSIQTAVVATLLVFTVARVSPAEARKCPYGPPCADQYQVESQITAASSTVQNPSTTYTALFDNYQAKYSEKLLANAPAGTSLKINKLNNGLSAALSGLSKADLQKFYSDSKLIK